VAENQILEYKQSWRDEYLKWVCGFANAHGGVLEVGRDDQGNVIGLSDVDRLLEELPNREAVLNAIAHKDYGSATPIQISVYDDQIMFWNPGHLPAEWTVEQLTAKHASQPHNPDLANAFFRAGMIEAWEQGIERIIEACRIAGMAIPEFQYDQTGLWLVFKFKWLTSSEKTPVKTPELVLKALAADPKLTLAEVANLIGSRLALSSVPAPNWPPIEQTTVMIEAQPEQTLVPYDENLPECTRTQWQFGEWQSLTKMNRDTPHGI